MSTEMVGGIPRTRPDARRPRARGAKRRPSGGRRQDLRHVDFLELFGEGRDVLGHALDRLFASPLKSLQGTLVYAGRAFFIDLPRINGNRDRRARVLESAEAHRRDLLAEQLPPPPAD